MNRNYLTFLKLGGSLLTDKSRPHTLRPESLERIGGEIARWQEEPAAHPLLIGHGSGSFGHAAAHRFGIHGGVHSSADWAGFIEVMLAAAHLNRLVLKALRKAGLQVISLAPSAGATAVDGQIDRWDTEPLRQALGAGLTPIIYGDVAFDRSTGGTILSTEALFAYLSTELKPNRILLAGVEEGVWQDFPSRTRLIPRITAGDSAGRWEHIQGSEGLDVTGGMRSKVLAMVEVVREQPDLEVRIFSALEEGNILAALSGEQLGTQISR